MAEVQCLKFQFEIRYTHILNFSTIIKEILAPYLKLASRFSVSNHGTLEESYRLEFEDDSFWIDCRWDRIVFLSERSIERFKAENTSVGILFEITEKLKERETFGIFTNYLVFANFLKVLDNSFEQNRDEIKSKYLTSKTDEIVLNPDDIAITLKKTNKGKDITVSFGPFAPEDIVERNLIPFKSPELVEHIRSSGVLMEIKVFEKTGAINNSLFKELINIINSYSKLI